MPENEEFLKEKGGKAIIAYKEFCKLQGLTNSSIERRERRTGMRKAGMKGIKGKGREENVLMGIITTLLILSLFSLFWVIPPDSSKAGSSKGPMVTVVLKLADGSTMKRRIRRGKLGLTMGLEKMCRSSPKDYVGFTIPSPKLRKIEILTDKTDSVSYHWSCTKLHKRRGGFVDEYIVNRHKMQAYVWRITLKSGKTREALYCPGFIFGKENVKEACCSTLRYEIQNCGVPFITEVTKEAKYDEFGVKTQEEEKRTYMLPTIKRGMSKGGGICVDCIEHIGPENMIVSVTVQ